MSINQHSLLKAAPIKDMLRTKERSNGRSYGLSEVGYDIRLKQRVVFEPYSAWKSLGIREGVWIHTVTVDTDSIEGNFCLASSIEEFQMPDNIVGIVHDKSTNIREGIQVFNTVIEPGWNGFLTLELAFHGNKKVVLEAGTPIAQVIFSEIMIPIKYEGKFQNQPDMPVGAIFED